MPVLLHMGPAAPCGLTRYESDAFGKAYQDNLFACYFNLHKVGRHVLTAQGATFTTKDEDFVSSPDLDFHPTDVLEDADGSLLDRRYRRLVQALLPDLAAPQARRAGGDLSRAPHGRAAAGRSARARARLGRRSTPDRLVRLIDDPRPAVQPAGDPDARPPGARTALGPLADRLRAVRKGRLTRSGGPRQQRLGGLPDRSSPRSNDRASRRLGDPRRDGPPGGDPCRRPLARQRSGPEADRACCETALRPDRRAAAEALGRIGDKAAVPALLEAAGQPADRILEHSITYALIEIADPQATGPGLRATDPRDPRAAMVALDQMDGGRLDPKFVAGLLALARADPQGDGLVDRRPASRVGRRAGRRLGHGWRGPTSRPASGPSWSGSSAGSPGGADPAAAGRAAARCLAPRAPSG